MSEDLVQRWANGDEAAARELLDAHFERLHRFFWTKADALVVEDLIQKTLMACLGARHKLGDAQSFRAYMFTVARHELYAYWRKNNPKRRFDPLEHSVAGSATSPSEHVAKGEQRAALLYALRALPADLQMAIELRYWEGLTGPELAQVLELPEGTVRSRLRRALEKLRESLGQNLDEAQLEQSISSLEAWARQVRGGR